MSTLLRDLIFDYTLRNVALGSIVLGIVSGAMGSFAVLRKQSLLGDSISHAALPGIALAFMLTGSKAPWILLLGAALAGWLGTYCILSIVRYTRLKEDAAQGIVLSVFFGLGMVLLTLIQRFPTSTKAGLDKFLFGQAATLMAEDVITMGIVGFAAISVMLIFWKEFKLLSFDREYLASLGFPARRLETVLTFLIVGAIVIGLQTVGVVLMSAMLVAPAAAARQWTDRLGWMVGLSGFFGLLAGLSGALISSSIARLPTGPTIVMVLTVITTTSLLFATKRGIVWAKARTWRNRRVFAAYSLLDEIYLLSRTHERFDHPHAVETLKPLSGYTLAGTKAALEALRMQGLVQSGSDERYALTAAGRDNAASRLQGGA
ncbi:MAG: metal ABC transporter permease [Spirochaetia bacterium]|jgi:manganese/zinc/iron transport system permease protein|nr:metal ABC transporter permease [Spirochaetia bacterium]